MIEKMLQITIKIDHELFFKLLKKEIYPKLLIDDKQWHFFFEGDFVFLRFQETTRMEEIFEILEKYDYDCNIFSAKPYLENIGITNKYLSEFLDIFHAFSMLSIKIEDCEILGTFERVFHCFLNVFDQRDYMSEIFSQISKEHKQLIKEDLTMSMIGALRSMTSGYLTGIQNS